MKSVSRRFRGKDRTVLEVRRWQDGSVNVIARDMLAGDPSEGIAYLSKDMAKQLSTFLSPAEREDK